MDVPQPTPTKKGSNTVTLRANSHLQPELTLSYVATLSIQQNPFFGFLSISLDRVFHPSPAASKNFLLTKYEYIEQAP